MKFIRLILCAFVIMLPGWVKGQTELEIKTTGKYIYSWAIDNDLATASETAKLGLLDTIFVSILKVEVIDQTDTIFIKEIDYFERKIGFKWQVIAFADKSNIEIKREQYQKTKPIPIIIGSEDDSKNGDMRDQQPSETLHSKKGTSETKNIVSVNFNSGNSVLDELLIQNNAKSLKQMLERFKSELKLNYGSKANYPDDTGCYIFIIDKDTQHVMAVYDKGLNGRKDFLNQETDNNFKDKYKDNIFVYVVIN